MWPIPDHRSVHDRGWRCNRISVDSSPPGRCHRSDTDFRHKHLLARGTKASLRLQDNEQQSSYFISYSFGPHNSLRTLLLLSQWPFFFWSHLYLFFNNSIIITSLIILYLFLSFFLSMFVYLFVC